MTSQNFNWQQMDLLSEPVKEGVRVEKIEALASELIEADAAAIQQVIKVHKLNSRESKQLMELLNVNYILEVFTNGYNKS